MGEERKEKLIVIVGPTAVGKTALSVELAKKCNGEIISGDSMQIYRGMDIGTAKVKKEEMEGIPHHLLDIKNPDEPFSVAEFQKLTRDLIMEIRQKGKIPIIVGGTGLYIQSVIYDYQFSDVGGDETFRAELKHKIETNGIDEVFEQLKEIDPVSAKRIHPHNIRRVIRALEIYHCTGKTMTQYLNEQKSELLYDVAIIGLTMDREKLYERINMRVDMMVNEGLFDEVYKLYESGLRDCQSVQAIGYKELYEYFDGSISKEEAIEKLKQNSRRYAKRQLTWFRNKMEQIEWFNMTDVKNVYEKVDEIFTYIAGKLKL